MTTIADVIHLHGTEAPGGPAPRESWTLTEQIEHREQWVADLRSGKYRQTSGRLRGPAMVDEGLVVDGYCCIGVACAIAFAAVPENGWSWYPEQEEVPGRDPDDLEYTAGTDDEHERCTGQSPEWVMAYYGLDEVEQTRLIRMNDEDSFDFDLIADAIEDRTTQMRRTLHFFGEQVPSW